MEHKEILSWLTTIDYDPQQNYVSQRQRGTGKWFLASANFQCWLEADNRTLFCPGIPGAGKTFITSIVIDYLHNNYQNSNVAYIYCNIGQHGKQTPESLLGSILKQIVQGQYPLPTVVKDLYDLHKANRSRPLLTEIS